MWSTTNPYLNGFYDPLNNQQSECALRVVGEIPPDLNGSLYRATTNQRFRPFNPDKTHWFEGDAMVHAFNLRDGKATYSNRWIVEDGLRLELEAGKALYNGILSASGIVQGSLPEGAPLIKAPPNVNVISLAGKILAMSEASPCYWEISPEKVETLGAFNFDDAFADIGDQGALTAHPHIDMATGEMLFTVINAEANTMDCFTADAAGNVASRHRITLDAPSWIHDFAITKTYMVFFLSPLNARPRDPDRIPKGKGMTFCDPDFGSRVLLVNRATGATIRIAEQDLYMVTHFLNAYEEDGKIVVDACMCTMEQSPASLVVSDFFPFPLPGVGHSPFSMPMLHRWSIDPVAGTSVHARRGEFDAEFVRIGDDVCGRKHRHGYMAGMYHKKTDRAGFNCLIKMDCQEDSFLYQYLGADTDHAPGEPIFVPRPGATDEDDGWILSLWGDAGLGTNELVILDAQNFDGEPVARVKLDHRVTNGFHGNWVSETHLEAGRLARRAALAR